MRHYQYIERNPAVLVGKPVIKGTRISVELLIRKIGEGYSIQDLLASYPHLEKQQIEEAIQYAADTLANEETVTV